MTLRAQLERAYSAWLATKSHRWAAEVSRLNREIMKRTRPVRTAAAANSKDRAHSAAVPVPSAKAMDLGRPAR